MRVKMDGCFIGDAMLSSQVFSGDGQFVPVFASSSMSSMGIGNSHNNNDSGYNYSPMTNWPINTSVMDNNGFSDGIGNTNSNNISVANGMGIGTQPNWHQSQLYSNNDHYHHHQQQQQAVVSTSSGALVPQSRNGYYQVTPQNAETIMRVSQAHTNSSAEHNRLHYSSNENVPSSSSPAGTSVRSYPLRTQMKQQLQRDKALNEKKREESLGKNVGSDFRSSNPVNIQVATSPLQVVSQQGQIVNQKSSVLANPTLYHLQAKAKAEGGGGGKMARYSNGGGGSGSVPPGHASSTASAIHIPFNSLGVLTGKVALHGSAPPNVYSGIQTNYDSVPASPLQPESVRSVNSITSGCSDNTSEYHINDDLLNDGFNTIQLTDGQDAINSVASLPPQLLTGVGSTGRGHSGDGRLRVKGSSSSATARSAPTATGKVSPLSSEPDKDRKKKDNHNKIEKNRRKKINGNILELAVLLPKSSDEHLINHKLGEHKVPNSKGAILHHAVKYTKELQRENSEVKVLNEELKQELFEVKRKLQRYMEICQSRGISLPQATSINLIEKFEPQIKQEPIAFEDRNCFPGDPACYMEEDLVQGDGNVMFSAGEDDLGPPEVDLGLMGDMELT